MVTDMQAGGGAILSGLPLKNQTLAHDPAAEARPASKGAFAAIMAESDTETVKDGAPMTPAPDKERPETAPSDAERATAGEAEAAASSGDPDGTRSDAGEADETETRDGLPVMADETPPAATRGTGIAGHAVMTANGAGADGPTGGDQPVARGIGEGVRLGASADDATVAARSGVEASRGETKAVPVAERAAQGGVASFSALTNEMDATARPIAAAHGTATLAKPSGTAASVAVPLAPVAPTVAGAGGSVSRDAPLVRGGLSGSGSVFAVSTRATPDSARHSGEGSTLGRPNGAAVAQAFSLPGVTSSGSTPVTGAGGLSFFGPLTRSEQAQTSDGGSTVPDARLSGQHASAPSQTAPTATYRQDLPHQIAVQIAAAAEKGKAGTQKNIDLSLNPEELGRVRLRLSASEGGLNVVIQAERTETLDLLRRNIDMLAREFVEIGYEGASFDFADGQQEQDEGQASIPLPPIPDAPGTPPTVQTRETHVLALGDRLDIRL